MQRPPAYSAVKVGGERAYEQARAGRGGRGGAAAGHVHRFELLWREGERCGARDRVLVGHLRPQLVADLGDAYCEELERTAIGPFRLEDADPERRRAARRGARLPAGARRSTRPRRRRVGHGRRLPEAPAPSAAVRLTHGGELIAHRASRGATSCSRP